MGRLVAILRKIVVQRLGGRLEARIVMVLTLVLLLILRRMVLTLIVLMGR